MTNTSSPAGIIKKYFGGLSTKDIIISIIRIIFGLLVAFMFGLGKVFGGPEAWTMIGSVVSYIGITAGFAVFGLLAGLTELIGGILLAIGYKTKFVALGILGVMVMATIGHFLATEGMLAEMGPEMAIGFGIIALIFVIIGGRGVSYDSKHSA